MKVKKTIILSGVGQLGSRKKSMIINIAPAMPMILHMLAVAK